MQKSFDTRRSSNRRFGFTFTIRRSKRIARTATRPRCFVLFPARQASHRLAVRAGVMDPVAEVPSVGLKVGLLSAQSVEKQ